MQSSRYISKFIFATQLQIIMAKHLEQFYESPEDYTSMQPANENMYELAEICRKEDVRDQQSLSQPPPLPAPYINTAKESKHKESSSSKQQLFIMVLLCLILILLMIILGIAGWLAYNNYIATGNNVECTNAATGASSSNTNEWVDRVAQKVYDKLGNIKILTSVNGQTVWHTISIKK